MVIALYTIEKINIVQYKYFFVFVSIQYNILYVVRAAMISFHEILISSFH